MRGDSGILLRLYEQIMASGQRVERCIGGVLMHSVAELCILLFDNSFTSLGDAWSGKTANTSMTVINGSTLVVACEIFAKYLQ